MKRIATAARRAVAAVLCALSLLPLCSGCKGSQADQILGCDLGASVSNLDPQFSTDPGTRMILSNLFEGLLVRGPDGSYRQGVAASYDVSEDRLRYTFHLREDAAWQDAGSGAPWTGGTPVTAEDFVFAFQRIFRDNSPYTAQYGAIRGAELFQDSGDSAALGVRAEDSRTLIMELNYPDPLFLDKLCDPAASPCNREVLEQSRGRYGLEPQFVCGNGPFRLTRWDDSRVNIRRSETYRSEESAIPLGVNFFVGRNAASEFLDGNTDVALLSWESYERAGLNKSTFIPIQKTVWCIVFNQDHRIWGNPLLRQGIAYTVDRQSMVNEAPEAFQATDLLIPGGMRVLGQNYRELAPGNPPLGYDTSQGQRLFQMGLDALELDGLPSDTKIYVPELAKASLGIAALQQGWQKYLEAYISFETASPTQIQTVLRDGDYQMLLMPITPSDAEVSTLLDAFRSDAKQNYFGYRSIVYDELLDRAAEQHDPASAAVLYAGAEATLLADAVVVPICFETTYLAVRSGVEGVEATPFGDSLYFKYAQKGE